LYETVKSELQIVQYDVAKLSVGHIELEGERREVRAEMRNVQLAAMAFSIQLATEQRSNAGVVVFFAPRPDEAAIKALGTSVGVTNARVTPAIGPAIHFLAPSLIRGIRGGLVAGSISVPSSLCCRWTCNSRIHPRCRQVVSVQMAIGVSVQMPAMPQI
ncbi:hypothetical protein HaLaN_21954, partial [Haematococcus lacustris]